jgi:hypothetical protein
MRFAQFFADPVAATAPFLLLFAFGCADDAKPASDAGTERPAFDAGKAADRNAAEPGELCERLATIQCAGEAHCCSDPGRTFSECKTAMKTGCSDQLHLDEIAMQSVAGFDADAARAAFDDFEALARKCDTSIATWGTSTEGLRSILRGTLGAGENCAPKGAINDPVIGGAALASCADLAERACQPRSTQKDGKLDWTCDARSDVDELCFSDANCKDGLYCANPTNRIGAKCRPLKANGMPCNTPHECESLICKGTECKPVDRDAAYCLKH